MFTLCGLSVLIALVPLVLIFYRTVAFGFSAINWDFFTQMPKPVGESGGGLANAIVGTMILVGLGSCMSLPVGIMAGIYLAEYGNNWFGQSVRFLTDVLNGIPSIVTGVVAYTVVVLPMKHFSAYAGGVALGILMIPTITRTTEEILRTVPHSLREAALALGIPRWKTSLQIVLRTAMSGVVTGILLVVMAKIMIPFILVVQIARPAVDLLAIAYHHTKGDRRGALYQRPPRLKQSNECGFHMFRVVIREITH